jgi:gamma-D-glutamyl-L-lysine dipeptidyl-peptidase
VSQRVAGQTLDTLDDYSGDEGSGNPWLHVAGDDEYPGWAHRGYLTAGSWPVDPGTSVSLGCVVASGGGDSIRAHRALPLRALLAPGERCVAGRTVAHGELSRTFPLDPRAIAQSAQELFAGASYMWGGVTPWGADCSGFVQTVFALHGMPLPRDAWQQAGAGLDAGCDPAAAEAGDLLFFSEAADGRITHVGISLGGDSLVHVSLGRGGHAVDRLAATRDPYVIRLREFFRFARRVV